MASVMNRSLIQRLSAFVALPCLCLTALPLSHCLAIVSLPCLCHTVCWPWECPGPLSYFARLGILNRQGLPITMLSWLRFGCCRPHGVLLCVVQYWNWVHLGPAFVHVAYFTVGRCFVDVLKLCLEQIKHFLVFLSSLRTLLVTVSLLTEGIHVSILFPYTLKYIENGILANVVVQFLMYLAEKSAVRMKKSTKVSAWANEALSGVLSARCVYIIGLYFPAEWKFGRRQIDREWWEHVQIIARFTCFLCNNKSDINWLAFTCSTQSDKPVFELY